jgi:hypothetical protein
MGCEAVEADDASGAGLSLLTYAPTRIEMMATRKQNKIVLLISWFFSAILFMWKGLLHE